MHTDMHISVIITPTNNKAPRYKHTKSPTSD